MNQNNNNNNTNNSNVISLTEYEYNNYLLNTNTNITPQKRSHHHLTTPQSNNNNNNNQTKRIRSTNINGNNKLITGLRETLRIIFQHDNPSQIAVNRIYSEPAMIKLIEAILPMYSLGKGWTMNELPNAIPKYPWFNNQYNAKHRIHKPSHHNYHIGMDTSVHNTSKDTNSNHNNMTTSIHRIPTQYQPLQLFTATEWDKLSLDQQANIWSDNFKKYTENYKYKLQTKQSILETEKITPNMLSFGLQINILYVLKLINKHKNNNRNVNDKILNRTLFKYYIEIKELLLLWEEHIELNNFSTHKITYLMNCLLVVGHGFLICGILTEQIEHNKLLAREFYIKCIDRIRFVHKYRRENNNNNNNSNSNMNEMKEFKINNEWNPITNVSEDTLSAINCCEWTWLHYDLNNNINGDTCNANDNYDIGPYDGWIIESYHRLAWTYTSNNNINDKLKYLHRSLFLLRNKDGLGDIVSIRIIIDYAYTFLEKTKATNLDRYYWFYLINITFGLINMNPNTLLTENELFDIKTRFLCGCIMNKLCEQPNYISFQQNFMKDSMNFSKTHPSLAIHRFLRIGYTYLYYGEIREANNLYRAARALMQYYTHEQLNKPSQYPIGQRLMDRFEIWWDFNYFCLYAIACLTSYCIINYDSSYFNLLWDLVCWRNQCSRLMFKISGFPNDQNAKYNKYFGYFNEYKSNAPHLAFFGAQAMIIAVIHSANNCKLQPDYKYLYTVVLLLEMAKTNIKFKQHCEILGYYMEQQFELFAWTAEKKRKINDIIVIND